MISLLIAWSTNEPMFRENFEPAHGNHGYATASELAEVLQQYAEDNDDDVAYDGVALCAAALDSALEHMYQQQRTAGAAHGVTRRIGQWRAPGPRQGDELVLWRLVAAQAARRVAAKSRAEIAPSELNLRASLSRCAAMSTLAPFGLCSQVPLLPFTAASSHPMLRPPRYRT